MKNLQKKDCPICGNESKIIFVASDENQKISEDRFVYKKCIKCESVFIEQIPIDLKKYYHSHYYKIPTIEQMQLVANKDRNKIDTVLRYSNGNRLLEVGPSFGVFALQAKQAGFHVDVIEMEENCCTFLKNKVGVNVIESSEPQQVIKKLFTYDVIALWHVLEHLEEPVNFLKEAVTKLNKNGILVLAMPNPKSLQFMVMGKHWPHLDAPRHLTLIPETWITHEAKKLGLDCVYLTTKDSDALSWNIFGWQRLLMNRFENKFFQRLMFITGFFISILTSFFERHGTRGSSFTIILKKII